MILPKNSELLMRCWNAKF